MKIWGNRMVGAFAFAALGLGMSTSGFAAEASLENWIKAETPIALDRIYMAISPSDGAKGSMIASPQRSGPDYYFNWIRDAALTMREVWNFRALSPTQAQNTLIDYALFSKRLQAEQNPSSGCDSAGLCDYGVGEPKFEITGAPFMQGWGRPQNDGPALRVLALLGLADDLMLTGQQAFVYQNLYAPALPARTVIKADLEFVAYHWMKPSYDLWEEVEGDQFYTRLAQWRALTEGAIFATKMKDPEAAKFYNLQAGLIQASLAQFWNGSYLVATKNWVAGHPSSDKPSQLDIAIILGVNQSGKSGSPFYVADDRVIATAWKLVQTFNAIYGINGVRKNQEGFPMNPGLGRYPEDQYDGNTGPRGNPWFLATHAMAEYYLRLRGELKAHGTLNITDLNRPFYSALVGQSLAPGKRLNGDPTYAAVLQALADQSDAFIRRSKYHTGAGGRQSEQFNRDLGYMQSAGDLTWSYASFLSLRRIRETNHD
jgi:glucoamylase